MGARSAVVPQQPTVTAVGSQVTACPVTIPATSLGIYALATEAIQAGQPVRLTSSGLALAAATPELSQGVVGIALTSKQAGEQCLYASDGSVGLLDWRDITGTLQLTAGIPYFLGATTGTLTTSVPTSGAALRMGFAVSASQFDIEMSEAVILSTA